MTEDGSVSESESVAATCGICSHVGSWYTASDAGLVSCSIPANVGLEMWGEKEGCLPTNHSNKRFLAYINTFYQLLSTSGWKKIFNLMNCPSKRNCLWDLVTGYCGSPRQCSAKSFKSNFWKKIYFFMFLGCKIEVLITLSGLKILFLTPNPILG